MNTINPDAVRSDIVTEISSTLNSVGLMYRIFSRSKSLGSIESKIKSDSRYGHSKKIQDLIGVRVVLYFNDDIDTVREIISSSYQEKASDVSIDKVNEDEFRAVRYNIVYSLNEDHVKTLNLSDSDKKIDTTFELQIRTIFSEGWHEIEHDLRYKCKDDWKDSNDESRLLNGVYASLENSEWTMIKIFDEVAYRHYKARRWAAMLRQKLRLRFTEDHISSHLNEALDNDHLLAKKLLRVDREHLLSEMNKRGYYYPITLDNIIYFINIVLVNNQEITKHTPDIMISDMTQ